MWCTRTVHDVPDGGASEGDGITAAAELLHGDSSPSLYTGFVGMTIPLRSAAALITGTGRLVAARGAALAMFSWLFVFRPDLG